jgi:hypothetical protein
MVTISFALGDKPIPEYRRRISIVLNGKYMAVIHAVHAHQDPRHPVVSVLPGDWRGGVHSRVHPQQREPAFPKGGAQDRSGGRGSPRCPTRRCSPDALGNGYGGGAGAKERSRERRTLMAGKELSRTATGVLMP